MLLANDKSSDECHNCHKTFVKLIPEMITTSGDGSSTTYYFCNACYEKRRKDIADTIEYVRKNISEKTKYYIFVKEEDIDEEQFD